MEKILKLVTEGISLYATYLKITQDQMESLDSEENNESIVGLAMAESYYLGQLDALENIKNFIELILNVEQETKYAETIDSEYLQM